MRRTYKVMVAGAMTGLLLITACAEDKTPKASAPETSQSAKLALAQGHRTFLNAYNDVVQLLAIPVSGEGSITKMVEQSERSGVGYLTKVETGIAIRKAPATRNGIPIRTGPPSIEPYMVLTIEQDTAGPVSLLVRSAGALEAKYVEELNRVIALAKPRVFFAGNSPILTTDDTHPFSDEIIWTATGEKAEGEYFQAHPVFPLLIGLYGEQVATPFAWGGEEDSGPLVAATEENLAPLRTAGLDVTEIK